MADFAAFAATPATAQVQIATANTARDGTGTLGTVLTAGTNGSRIDELVICAAGTTTAGVVRLFVYDGTNTRLMQELLIPAVTPSTTVAAYYLKLTNLNLILKSGWALKAGTNNAETFNIIATFAGDL
jgi:hypothetical protein